MPGLRPVGYVAALIALVLLAGVVVGVRPAPPPAEAADLPLRAVPKLDRPLRLAVMGTSLTARYAWPGEVAAALSGCLPHPVELGVFAEPGMGSAWGESVVAEMARFDPDIVLIEFVANDSDLREFRSVEGSRASHEALVAALRAGGHAPSIALVTTNPAFRLRGMLRPRMEAFNAMYRSLARQAGLGLVDAAPRWHAMLAGTQRRSVLPDGLHPTDEAQSQVMLAAILPVLGEALMGAYPACAGLKS